MMTDPLRKSVADYSTVASSMTDPLESQGGAWPTETPEWWLTPLESYSIQLLHSGILNNWPIKKSRWCMTHKKTWMTEPLRKLQRSITPQWNPLMTDPLESQGGAWPIEIPEWWRTPLESYNGQLLHSGILDDWPMRKSWRFMTYRKPWMTTDPLRKSQWLITPSCNPW